MTSCALSLGRCPVCPVCPGAALACTIAQLLRVIAMTLADQVAIGGLIGDCIPCLHKSQEGCDVMRVYAIQGLHLVQQT